MRAVERQFEFADALRLDRELRAAHAARLHRDGLSATSSTSENQSSGCSFRLTSPRAPE